LEEGHVWQHRFYDFVVFSEKKRVEKLRYMHRNPVKRGLVLEAQQWSWSSFCHHAEGQHGLVLVNEERKAELRVRETPDTISRNSHLSKSATGGAASFVVRQRWASPPKLGWRPLECVS
jgi:hypothetical protein